MPQTMPAPPILQGPETLRQRVELSGPKRARPGGLFLQLGQFLGHLPTPQQRARSLLQLPQVKLFWLAVFLVKIPAGAAVAFGQAGRLKTARPIAGAPIQAL